jgi:hypothetical protein
MATNSNSNSEDIAIMTTNNNSNSKVARRKPARAVPPASPELATLDGLLSDSTSSDLLVTNYPEDEAVRHATLSAKEAHVWPLQDGAPYHQYRELCIFYTRTDGTPMERDDAIEQLLRVRESTVLTLRIALGLWNLRRNDQQLCLNGSAAIRIEEILAWRGVKKHSRVKGTVRQSDGWQTKDLDAVREDFLLAASFYLRGYHPIWKRGKCKGRYVVTAPYIRVTFVDREDLWGNEELAGVFVAPGDWINDYEHAGNFFLTPIDRRVFALNPQNEKHELRLALFLTERWRKQAKTRAYSTPITMETLLQESVIPVNEKNLTNRFAPRIEQALAHLQRKGIIGSYRCLTPVDRSMPRWGNAWLGSQWCILPPDEIITVLERIVRPELPALPFPSPRAA